MRFIFYLIVTYQLRSVMEVYVLTRCEDHEGGSVEGVFMTKEGALTHARRHLLYGTERFEAESHDCWRIFRGDRRTCDYIEILKIVVEGEEHV